MSSLRQGQTICLALDARKLNEIFNLCQRGICSAVALISHAHKTFTTQTKYKQCIDVETTSSICIKKKLDEDNISHETLIFFHVKLHLFFFNEKLQDVTYIGQANSTGISLLANKQIRTGKEETSGILFPFLCLCHLFYAVKLHFMCNF